MIDDTIRNGRRVLLDRIEVRAMLYTARNVVREPRIYWAIWLQYLLGARIGEIRLLRYDHLLRDVNGRPYAVNLPTLKKKSPDGIPPLVPVPILSHSDMVVHAFNPELRGRPSNFLFPATARGHLEDRPCHVVTLHKSFQKVRQKSNVWGTFGTHALRHTAASYLYEHTKDLLLVGRFLRHSNSTAAAVRGTPPGASQQAAAVTNRYIHFSSGQWNACKGALDLPLPLGPL